MPESIETHRDNPDYSDGVWVMVDIDLTELSTKAKRINITLPERILHTVDHYAKSRNLSRSGLIAQALTQYMAVSRC